jgi:hypothetical protein
VDRLIGSTWLAGSTLAFCHARGQPPGSMGTRVACSYYAWVQASTIYFVPQGHTRKRSPTDALGWYLDMWV